VGKKFKHHRVGKMIKVDLSPFGEIPLRLQRELKALDRRAHVAMLPAVAYLVGLGVWFAVR
jgi:hypothetical protein